MSLTVASSRSQPIICRLHYKKIDATANPDALSELFASLEAAAILGGNNAQTDANRYSYWMAEPVEIFEFYPGRKQPFEKLQRLLAKYCPDRDLEHNLPKKIFHGGWVGYFSYELGRYIEKLPATTLDNLKLPLIRLCFYDKLICFDHQRRCFWLIALELNGDIEKPQEKLAYLESLLEKSRHISPVTASHIDIENLDFSHLRSNMDKNYYIDAVEKIRRYIYDGEVYQVNFSQCLQSDYPAKPIELYHWQNHYNPSAYSAYFDCGRFHIVSASPEMFITITDRVISTKPIKGTRPRLAETSRAKPVNLRNFNELLASEKEQAELNMIIDLERNDLGRICQYGTIKVVQPRTIENYPTVFHAVATIQGILRREISFCDILRAMFPGGSITGAPKIRSMEIIDQLEPTARGIYTGSIGFIGIDGNVCLNIAIRTIIIKDKMAFFQSGGGIVADSNAEAEWQETITKARALLAGIESVTRIARRKNQTDARYQILCQKKFS
ncbi:MAG: anthranilate synthase component I family protein [Planctomycetota bacterium]|jgi:para-aminobenzoate synthetase component 1